jgi:methylphosphotriester-DNA--protein-cysteine methyltransferase
MDIRDLVRLRKAKDRMDREFERPLDVPALASSAAMSTGHFSRSFKAAFGESPYSYLMTRRIERAKALLTLYRARRRVAQRLSSAQPLGGRSHPRPHHQGDDKTDQKRRSGRASPLLG